MKSAIKTVQGQ